MTIQPAEPSQTTAGWGRVGAILLWGVLPLALGLLLALGVPRPEIGLITLDDDIDGRSAARLIRAITYARDHPEIRAVVLEIDSPGGTVVDTERVYMELHRLRQVKPVVTVIGNMAASGGYYVAAGTDYIYALPASRVGNVGIIGFMPYPPAVFENPLTSGPYKMWGRPRDTALRQMDVLKQGFYQAVKLGRGEALKVGPDVLLRGELWPGGQALQMGLIDALGTREFALDKAAELARIAHYGVVDLDALLAPEETPTLQPLFGAGAPATPTPRPPGLYMLYVPPQERRLP
jgi:protease-4